MALREHLNNHGMSFDVLTDDPECEYCQVTPLLTPIHRAYFDGLATEIYALQDGYGQVGLVPEQGLDWSGVRDSTPEAIRKMYDFVKSKGYEG